MALKTDPIFVAMIVSRPGPIIVKHSTIDATFACNIGDPDFKISTRRATTAESSTFVLQKCSNIKAYKQLNNKAHTFGLSRTEQNVLMKIDYIVY